MQIRIFAAGDSCSQMVLLSGSGNEQGGQQIGWAHSRTLYNCKQHGFRRLSPKSGDALNVRSSAVTTVTVVTDVTAGTEVPTDTVGTVVTADTVGTLYRCKQDGLAYRHLSWWRTITCVIQPPVGGQ